MAAHLAACPTCRHALSEVAGDLALLGMAADSEPLPAGARERFVQRIAAEPRSLAQQTRTLPFIAPASARRRPLLTFAPWMLAAAMLVAAVYLGSQVSQLRSSRDQARAEVQKLAVQSERAQEVLEVLTAPTAQRVTLTEGKPAPAPTGRTSYMPEHGALVFVASNLHALPPSKAYELWVIPANGHPPMPAGMFRPDEHGSASVVLPPLPVGIAAKAFAVTIEAAEGSPVPTSPVLMSGS